MKIPKSFKIFGQTINVKSKVDLLNRDDQLGAAHYRFNEILMQNDLKRPASKIEQTFCHELVHFLLYYTECTETKDLFRNEFFVERLSCALHQALTTMEFEED